MPFHIWIDNGPVESSQMRATNVYRAVIQMFSGKIVTPARYKGPDGHWMVVMWVSSSIESTYDRIRLMCTKGYITSFDKRYEFEEVP